ncbi:hypothetical protein Btru_056118 [Bulinus truncatus]|nr:hypothetical protein Btru_056118 [Bulinus truncatus]
MECSVHGSNRVIDQTLYDVTISVFFLFSCNVIGVVGIASNIINIIVFRKQGYKDGFNITLTALAVSDIGVLVIQIVYIQATNPWTDESNFIILKNNMAVLLIYPNEYFIRVSGFITSFASFQRCLRVLLPLKVKIVLNVKVAYIVNVTIFIGLTVFFLLPYSLLYVDWKILPNYNRSVLYIFYKNNRESIINVHYLVNGICVPFFTMFMLLVFTVILIVKIKSSMRWRNKVSNKETAVNYKERKTV